MKHLGNNSQERLKLKDAAISSLRSSRRCISAEELVRTAEMGLVTTNGCRKIKRDNKKSIEICFCSDQDMCNKVTKLRENSFIYASTILFVFMFIL